MSTVFIESFRVVMQGVNAVWGWFDQLMDALPGAFDFIVIGIFLFLLFRILMGRLVSFQSSSDTAIDRRGRKFVRTSSSYRVGGYSKSNSVTKRVK